MPNNFNIHLSNRSQSDLKSLPNPMRNRIIGGLRQLEILRRKEKFGRRTKTNAEKSYEIYFGF
jgi:hypothetical protein